MAFIYVVIPVFNAKEFLNDTVCSVIRQPYKNINIILVDDGSTDGSSELCDKLAKKEERIIAIHQENCGVSVARNRGIEYILENGKNVSYIAFLDADDFWCKNSITLQKVEEMMKENADIVGFSTYISNASGLKAQVLGQYRKEIVTFSGKYQTQILWAKASFASHLYHLRIFSEDGIRFDPKCRKNEDVIFSAKMLFCAKKILYYDNFLYVYRRNRMSVTSTNKYTLLNATHIPDAWYVAAKQFDEYEDVAVKTKENWRQFCLSISSMRCLEMIRWLAEGGYSVYQIDECFKTKEYYQNIATLPENIMPDWQKSDLIQYKKNFQEYCNFYQKKGRYNRMKRRLVSLGLIQNLIDYVRYKIPL